MFNLLSSRTRLRLLAIATCSAVLFTPVFAQKTISMADAFNKRVALSPANLRQIQWIPGTDNFTHTVGKRLVRVNANDLTTDTLDLLAGINEGMTKLNLKTLEGIPPIVWESADRIWFHTEKEALTYSIKDGLTLQNSQPSDAENIDYQDKTYNSAYTVGDDLYISIGGKQQLVAMSDSDGIVYGKSVHRDEFGINKGTYWSASGRYLAFYRMDESMVTKYPIYVLDSLPATARYIRYPYAGSKSHHVTVGVFDTKNNHTTYLQTGLPVEQYLTNVAWTPDDKYILIAVVNREQNHYWLRQYDAQTGAYLKTILEETNDKWTEPEQPAVFVPGSNTEFVWQSERDGFNHLYRYNLDGQLLAQLSKGNSPVINFYGFSADGKRCFYQKADETGLNRSIWAADIKTGTATALNNDPGTHNAIVSKAGDWYIDVFSDVATPRLIYTQKTQAAAPRNLIFGAKNPLTDYKIGQTRLTTIPSAGGFTLNARLIVPPDYDPNRKYPAIVYVYNGPHVQMVTNSWMAGGELWMHRMACEGFVILSVDGRGSANRGFAFESGIHRHVGDLEMEDQLTGVQYLKAQTFIDPARIGVYGWSYGGFMATSLMTRPEAKGVFKCGIAGGPVMDWSMYEIMYGERYMDMPQENPDGYAKNKLENYIDNLNGPLLLIHGSSDPVVLMQHTMRYVRECVRKGKPIDYFIYPEHEHNVIGRDRVHLFEKIEAYFKQNL